MIIFVAGHAFSVIFTPFASFGADRFGYLVFEIEIISESFLTSNFYTSKSKIAKARFELLVCSRNLLTFYLPNFPLTCRKIVNTSVGM